MATAFTILWFVTCLYALIRGGAPERVVALALVIAAPLTRILRIAFSHGYRRTEPELVIVDLMLLAVLIVVALRSTRHWPMLATSMHGVAILGHAAKALSPEILPGAYYVLVSWWGFAIQLLLAMATWRHRVRLRVHGHDPSWASHLATSANAHERTDPTRAIGGRPRPAPPSAPSGS